MLARTGVRARLAKLAQQRIQIAVHHEHAGDFAGRVPDGLEEPQLRPGGIVPEGKVDFPRRQRQGRWQLLGDGGRVEFARGGDPGLPVGRIALHAHQLPGTRRDFKVAQPGNVIAVLDGSGKDLLEALPHGFLPAAGTRVPHRRQRGKEVRMGAHLINAAIQQAPVKIGLLRERQHGIVQGRDRGVAPLCAPE